MTTLQQVELGVLGTLQVRQYGLPVAIPGAKPRAILTMLGLYGGSAVSADMLVELLWGDDPPRTAAKALQTHISALRRTLGDGFVLTEGTGWTVRTTEIDATRYKAAVRLGRDAIAAGDVGQAVARFDEALNLWRGTPELPDSARGTSEKTRWVEGHDALVEDRADALLATGRAAEIIGELEAAVADAPLRERRWGQLMLALYRAGRQGEALGAYQRARSLLAEELGVDPGPDLRRLEAAIVAQDDALELPVAQQLSAITRAVTFLLTDIEGSTAAWETDADAMAVALARHDELVEQVVTSRGGRLIKTRGEGDATFSVFDRPSGAAAAAIELQEAIRHEPWALAEPMRIRVALHTGEVELRGGDYFGRAVNRAARLRSLALGGQILCSGATAELVIDTLSDDVLLVDLGSRQLKNLARPEHVFELRLDAAETQVAPTAEAPPIERPELPAVLAGTGPFVGRALELERLLSAWESMMDAGARAVLIAGEPGVGKTRLAGEWSRQAYEQGAVVIYGRCDEDLGVPYQPFAEALRSLVPCLGADRLRGLRGVESLLSMVPGLADALPDLAGPTRADADTDRYALFDAVVALLGAASASAPVVLILDDLHWAAKPTLLLLRHLLRFGEHVRVQIVGTYRSTDLDRSHPLAAMLADLHRDGTAHRLQLDGLDEDDVTAYVTEAGYDDEELARALAAVTGGNPFFLIEALRHVDESGGRWDPSTLPQGVREAVSRRLSRLPVQTNKALAAAAVVGSRFAVDLVERVVDQDLIDAFDEACKAGIIIEEPGGQYRFNHALVRQSLLAELASVRRMRLHQRIAVTLENEPGADDELLSELAHHYFECAWAGNAAKAVDYCRRAADQAMTRLAYEGAADLYDRALHALEELDDELPDREDQQAELLVARCEALLAAGDVVSASGAVDQLLQAAGNSARLAAWGACFDGEVSMLTDPERLDEIESAVAAAAEELAGLNDAAGEAKAHTVRALCLGRLGRIADCETALDQALTAARRAGDHRRVNAVLATAPLAALWGPNPVPRAGGRCLDVVRLLRITTGSPVVEATSTRCQGVLDAFRGRAAAGRQLIESARRSLSELGMRHALLEVEQFAGLVELVADDPAAAEPHLRHAYNGFRRMGLDADTAETAAMLARACLALDRDAEADELCVESERLAGHASKAAIAWRIVRAQLLSRRASHEDARRVAEDAIVLAGRTDALVDHGDACLALATVLAAAGNAAEARAAAEKALELYDRKGAAALAEKARNLLVIEHPEPPAETEEPTVELENACVRVIHQTDAAIDRGAWDECDQLFAPDVSVQSRRKVVGFSPADLREGDWPQVAKHLRAGWSWHRSPVVAVRGERLALTRIELGTDDSSPGAPHEEFLGVWGLDDHGRIALQRFFDLEDLDAAVAELDVLHRAIESAPTDQDTACVRVARKLDAAYDRNAWDELEGYVAPVVSCESRRKVVGVGRFEWTSSEWLAEARHYRETLGEVRYRHVILAVRGERLALTTFSVGPTDQTPGAPRDELVQLYGLDEEGRLALQMWFDVEDMDVAIAELDAAYTRLEGRVPTPTLENAASRVDKRFQECFIAQDWDAMTSMLSSGTVAEDRRRVVNAGSLDRRDFELTVRAYAAVESQTLTSTVIATRGQRLAMTHHRFSGRDHRPDAFSTEMLVVIEIDADERMAAIVTFDLDDFDAAIAELDARYLAGEAAPHRGAWSVVAGVFASLNRNDLPSATSDWISIDHRRGTPLAETDLKGIVTTLNELTPDLTNYIEVVHLLHEHGAVVTQVSRGTSPEGFDAEWRMVNLLTVDGDVVNRCELFDEDDVDAAVARLDSLGRSVPQLDNTANRILESYLSHFASHEWDLMAPTLADDFYVDDRRRVVNGGVRHGGETEIANLKVFVEIGCTNITTTPVAIRGERLVLARHSFIAPDWPDLDVESIDVVEINTDNRIMAEIIYDVEDLDDALAELDARYLAGEAARYAQTWAVVVAGFEMLNRHELPAVTSEYVIVDHQWQHATGEAHGLVDQLRAMWELTPDLRMHIESVHRLSDLGAVITLEVRGTSVQGFEAESREVILATVDADLINRCEMFDETDLDAALARFDELSRPTHQLENVASQVCERFKAYFAARDWDSMAGIVAEDVCYDDRRRVVGVGVRRGRDAHISNLQAIADVQIANIAFPVVATRGARLVLSHSRYVGPESGPQTFVAEALEVIEIDADELVVRVVTFDDDDLDAAYQELNARYIAGEAAANAHVWSVVSGAYAAVNRHELPPWTADAVSIDHRSAIALSPGDLASYIHAMWGQTPDVRVDVVAVHRLTSVGALVTHVATGTTEQGFEGEWREITLSVVEGDRISRSEMFDEADLDAALAKFDQFDRPDRRFENAASRIYDRVQEYNALRDWDAVASLMAEDLLVDDRRPMMGAGIRHGRGAAISDMRTTAELGLTHVTSVVLAIRGERLLLIRSHHFRSDDESDDFVNEVICLYELNDDDQVAVGIIFNPDEIDAAMEELETRYLNGEGAAYAHTWGVITRNVAAFNRAERSTTTPDWITIDHRRVARFAPKELSAAVGEFIDSTPEFRARNIAIHRLSDRGAVVTTVSHGTSSQGFEAEWKVIQILTVDGDFINRCELFDETDLDAALARFDKIAQPAERLENAASRVEARAQACIAVGDWDALAGVLAADVSIDDRRRVVNAGLRRGRDAVVEDLRVGAEIGLTRITPTAIATRGESLTLRRIRYSGGEQRPEVGVIDLVQIVEIGADERIVALVLFDADDLPGALAELDNRYLGGEAAEHARTWSLIKEDCDLLNQQQLPTRPDFVFVDRRRVASIGAADVDEFFQAAWELTPDMTTFIESVHRLSDVGAVVSQVAHGTSNDGFYAEWRVINLYKVDEYSLSRCEVFDETDLDAAITRFEELVRPARRLENAATRVIERFTAQFAAQNWDAVAGILAEDVCDDDRRRVVNSAIQRGRDAQLANLRVLADVGVGSFAPIVIATRGQCLALTRTKVTANGHQSDTFFLEMLTIGEINANGQLAVSIHFDDVGSAFAELDARYLAGEAAPYAHIYSVIAESFAAVNRRELPTTATNFVSIDHRRPIAFAPGEMMTFLQAVLNDAPEIRIDIEAVHRLNSRGAVVSHTLQNTSQQGFDAEWRVLSVTTVDGDLIDRCELFDEADLDAALARFDELSHPAHLLESAASQVVQRFNSSFTKRDWSAMAEILAENIFDDDRRRVVNAGTMRGRGDVIADVSALANIGARSITSQLIATRGPRLVLNRARYSGREERPESFHIDALDIVGINADNQIVTHIAFDPDDIDAAFKELDSRYLADEAALYADTWTVITQAYSALNRHELPSAVSDLVHDDHHRLPLWKDNLAANLRAAWEVLPDWHIQIVAVHRLTNLGAVMTCVAHGTSHEGFDAEVPGIAMVTVQGGQINRIEYFDDSDLDTAIARFEELSRSLPRLGNAASRVYERRNAYFAARDWDALAETLADDVLSDDRRPVVNTGATRGRDAQMANNRAAADVGVTTITSTVIATRGERLALCRSRISGRDRGPEAFQLELLGVVEIDADERMVAYIAFEVDDLGAALAELDARYLAGEAAAHSRTWSVIKDGYGALNRHEIPPTTPNWVNIDHRRGGSAFASGEMATYIRSSWEDSPLNRIHVETVHRLSDLGAVVTSTTRGESVTGFYAEWREVGLVTVDGEKINRTELFDESDLDAALAKFGELSSPARLLENAAGRVAKRARGCFAARDWDGMRATLAEDFTLDDRRRTVNGGMRHGGDSMISDARTATDVGLTGVAYEVMAVRGERLILTHTRYSESHERTAAFFDEVLEVIELDDAGTIAINIVFDPDDIDAAFAELDTRYAAREAAPYAHTWSAVAPIPAAFNRREFPVTTRDCINIDHRRGTAFSPGELTAYMRATWDMSPEAYVNIESVHRLSDFGAVVTHAAHAVSQDGFAAEWRVVNIYGVTGDRISRCEIFDEDELDAALARFDELCRRQQQLRNVASEVNQRLWDLYAARDWNSMAALLSEEIITEDRRRVVNAGVQHGRDIELNNMRALANIGSNVTSTVIATRGRFLALGRIRFQNGDLDRGEFSAEMLNIIEVDDAQQIVRGVLFETQDIDAAFNELDARYLAGEAAPHAQTWSAVAETHSAYNRDGRVPNQSWVGIDHRKGYPTDKLGETMRIARELTPDFSIYIECAHRLSDRGAVITNKSFATGEQGFTAEWRMIQLMTVDGDHVAQLEIFDEDELDAALARFDELSRPSPGLKNAASRVATRFRASFAARDWDAMAKMLAEDLYNEDRRPVVNAGIRHGRDSLLNDMRSAADIGIPQLKSIDIATRGESLVLARAEAPYGVRPGAFYVESLAIAEIDGNGLVTAQVVFGVDEFAAALMELDARYAAGEASAHSHTWSAIAEAYAAFNRREMPQTTPDWVSIDHRRAGRAFAPGDQTSYIHATWEVAPRVHSFAATVHRLNDLGAVVTQVTSGTSHQGFDVEWQDIVILTVDGDQLSRCEVFDEADLDTALATFDELTAPAPSVENPATQVWKRLADAFNRRDVETFLDLTAPDGHFVDRRKGLRDSHEGSMRRRVVETLFEYPRLWRLNVENIAVRGSRVCLIRQTFRDFGDVDRPITVEVLAVSENSSRDVVYDFALFDHDELDAAFEEVESRYVAGEAAAHASVWSVIASTYGALNRRELPQARMARIHADHRSLDTLGPSTLAETVRASWDLVPDLSLFVEIVHRLSRSGAVLTIRSLGTSHDGFDAEWRMTHVLTIEGDRIDRLEIFDEPDIDAAVARFDELSSSSMQVDTAASRMLERYVACYRDRDWDGMAEMLADNFVNDDRRSVVNSGTRIGRDTHIADSQAGVDIGSENISSRVLATRGQRLIMAHVSSRIRGYDETVAEMIGVGEIDSENRVVANVIFDIENIDDAFAELDTRYLEGEAADHAQVWSVVLAGFAALSRRELPPTTRDWVNIDHRRGTSVAPGEVTAFLRAARELTPRTKLVVEAVHRLSDIGAVVTYVVNGTSHDGFEAEWREIGLLGIERDLIARLEIFDMSDLGTALAKFDQLSVAAPQCENAVTKNFALIADAFNRRDLNSFLGAVTADARYEDRRKGLRNEGPVDANLVHAMLSEAADGWRLTIDPIAVRGHRLALSRYFYRDANEAERPIELEALVLREVADDQLTDLSIVFDPEDIDAAFDELESRYLAGEAQQHTDVWSDVIRVCGAFNRRDVPAATPDWVNIDHRRATAFAPGELTAYLHATWDLSPSAALFIEDVHRLTDRGAVITLAAHATSRDGFSAEWRVINLFTFEGHLLSRVEIFDDSDVGAAVAGFDDLSVEDLPLANAATRGSAALADAFNRRDVDGLVGVYDTNALYEDRRRGLRNVGLLNRDFGLGLFELEPTSGWRLNTDPIGIRGNNLALVRHTYRDTADPVRPITVEALLLTEAYDNESIRHCVLFDPDDIGAAFAELTARWVASGEVEHPEVIESADQVVQAYNRHDWNAMESTEAGAIYVNHRQLAGADIETISDHWSSIRALASLVPDMRIEGAEILAHSAVGLVSKVVVKGATAEGAAIELPAITLLLLDGESVARMEAFDANQRHLALARFHEFDS